MYIKPVSILETPFSTFRISDNAGKNSFAELLYVYHGRELTWSNIYIIWVDVSPQGDELSWYPRGDDQK